MSIKKELFGVLSGGEEIYRYTLQNTNGMRVCVLNFGGAIQQLWVPDKNGRLADIVCGFDKAEYYQLAGGQQGSLVGRFCNRIANGRFVLDGREHQLACNSGAHHLHGGTVGFHKRIWRVTPLEDENALSLEYLSPDGEEGYPGTLRVTVTYTLTDENALRLHYSAVTDQKTVVNLTNHAYFNLAGFDGGNVLSHLLWVDADRYLPVTDTLVPTGEIASVRGTPFDFLEAKPLGRDFSLLSRGYDQCLVFADRGERAFLHRVTLYHPQSGREMKVYTDQPAMQLYTGNYLAEDPYPFKNGVPQLRFGAVCPETQKMPDSPNHPNFSNAVLCAAEVYDYTTEYRFSVK